VTESVDPQDRLCKKPVVVVRKVSLRNQQTPTLQKCGVLLNIWLAEQVVSGDESLHLQLW